MKIYNTLTGKKETFKPLQEGVVRLYHCGPTVQGYTHVGNARAALTLDLMVRTLKHFGYKVDFARNFTDVDDKIIARALRENKTAQEVSEFFIEAYKDDLRKLGTLEPTYSPKVTESMPEIIEFIKGLIQKGFAYELKTEVGTDIYFRVQMFKSYGKLSHRNLDDLVSGSRADVEHGKEHEADFALWKAARPNEPKWESPWGPGRPGWHIECSAMIHKIFHETLDIHMGGIDLIFPHHENEIAQSESLTGKPLATYWTHNGMLELGHEKMSKSLGNIVATRDFLNDYHPEVLRLLYYQQHYRGPLDFSPETLGRAESLLERLYLCVSQSQKAAGTTLTTLPSELTDLKGKMEEALADDLNTAKALGACLSAARFCFREGNASYWTSWRECISLLQDIFGVLRESPDDFLQSNRILKLRRFKISEARSQEIEHKLKERENLRTQKEFKRADEIRLALESEGILVMDSPDGTTWTLKG